MTSKAERRRKRQNRQGPSAPRVIGANDNVISPSIDDRDVLAKRVARARQAEEREDAISEESRLSGQGVDVVLAGGKIVRAKRVGGLEWLLRKERINLVQYRAGEQYGDDFAKAEEPSFRSCLNDRVGGEPEPMQETKRAAAKRLAVARSEALGDHEGLISLLDAVCGHGARVRALVNGDDAEAGRKEAQLALGLDFLARHYGMV